MKLQKLEYDSKSGLTYIQSSGKPVLFTTSSLKIISVNRDKDGHVTEFTCLVNHKEIDFVENLEKVVINDNKVSLKEEGIKRMKSLLRDMGESRGLRVKPVIKRSFKTTLLDKDRQFVTYDNWDKIITRGNNVHVVLQVFAMWKAKDMFGVYLRPIQIVQASSS